MLLSVLLFEQNQDLNISPHICCKCNYRFIKKETYVLRNILFQKKNNKKILLASLTRTPKKRGK